MGRRLLTDLESTSLKPWGPAADLPPGTLANGRVAMELICGLHVIEYPYALVMEASEGREHVFWCMCPCGEAYIIQTELDSAHLRRSGSPASISAFYDKLPGELVVVDDDRGRFACKRLVRQEAKGPLLRD
jgi:hypothetical protein